MKNTKGFTLIELMIVIAILGILLALIIPILAQKAEEVEGAKKQKVIEMVLEENDELIQKQEQQREGFKKL